MVDDNAAKPALFGGRAEISPALLNICLGFISRLPPSYQCRAEQLTLWQFNAAPSTVKSVQADPKYKSLTSNMSTAMSVPHRLNSNLIVNI